MFPIQAFWDRCAITLACPGKNLQLIRCAKTLHALIAVNWQAFVVSSVQNNDKFNEQCLLSLALL